MAQHYDVTLKTLLGDTAGCAVYLATGLSVEKWLSVELPKIANPRLDLLGETLDGTLLHLELQVSNDPDMPQRMAEYALAIHRVYGTFARQVVLYAGEPELGMRTSLQGPGLDFRFEVIDLRELDGEMLLASENVGDNVLAILTRLHDQRGAVAEILRKIQTLNETKREQAVQQLFILAGLRGMEELVEEGMQKMETLNDIIMRNKVLGREYKRGLEEGKQEGKLEGELKGKLEGKMEGKLEGELTLLRRLIEKRFGVIPEWAEERLHGQPAADLEALGIRLFDAGSLEQLLQ